ncbi:MAG: S8 family serine peptidase, partial [Chloroflexota bacterium]|nr:S8 family serine peptidase [Chloroflexota bacterium]
MQRSSLVLVALLVAMASAASPAVAASPTTSADASSAAGQRSTILVRFASSRERDAAVARLGAARKRPVGATGFERIEVPGPADAAVAALRSLPGVLDAEIDGRVHATFTPNDPYYPSDPLTGMGEWGIRDTRTNAAWDVQRGSSSITIAVVDTGVDLGHPDLAGSLVPGTRIVSSPDARCAAGTDASDDNGHGTHVAGIAAASGNDGFGIAGVAFGVRVMPVKVLDCTGAGLDADVAEGITYAADHGARVINMSLGEEAAASVTQAAVAYAIGKGVVVVAAAGNCGQVSRECPIANAPEYPGSFPGVLAVGAVDSGDTYASFSTANAYVGITAPGVGIFSDFPRYPVVLGTSNAGFAALSGTSMATPFVSGAAALLLSQQPTLAPAAVVARLEATADKVGGQTGFSPQYGNGRLDTYRALTDPWPTTPIATPIPAAPAPNVAPAPSAAPSPAPTPAPKPMPLIPPAGA